MATIDFRRYNEQNNAVAGAGALAQTELLSRTIGGDEIGILRFAQLFAINNSTTALAAQVKVDLRVTSSEDNGEDTLLEIRIPTGGSSAWLSETLQKAQILMPGDRVRILGETTDATAGTAKTVQGSWQLLVVKLTDFLEGKYDWALS